MAAPASDQSASVEAGLLGEAAPAANAEPQSDSSKEPEPSESASAMPSESSSSSEAEVSTSLAPEGEPWVVSLGDSYISGEGGRWAGNQTWSTGAIDALGPDAYHDNGSKEAIKGCHRSTSAAIHIGDVQSANLACSGAKVATVVNSDGTFKPGIDFYDKNGNKGQALMLEEFASQNRVGMIAMSIGGNDFKFAPLFAACVKAYLEPSVFGAYCQDDETVRGYIDGAATDRVRAGIKDSILNVATAMENAGYQDSQWTIGMQLYPSVLADASQMRYSESGYNRQLEGGCGFRDKDADWAIHSILPMINETIKEAVNQAKQERPSLQAVILDTTQTFDGHSLCNKTVNRVKTKGGANNWQDADAVDKSEWVMEVNMVNPRDTYGQESLHPNYWGQLALRSCWRQAWNGGDVKGGKCLPAGKGLSSLGEPKVSLS